MYTTTVRDSDEFCESPNPRRKIVKEDSVDGEQSTSAEKKDGVVCFGRCLCWERVIDPNLITVVFMSRRGRPGSKVCRRADDSS